MIFGYLTTRRAGTPFAMITLGIGEMVFAASLMFPGFFGGEGGITADRASGRPFLGIAGITFGPQIQVYYLIAVWCFVCMIAMYALTQTPLGRIANAVRDNPERAGIHRLQHAARALVDDDPVDLFRRYRRRIERD